MSNWVRYSETDKRYTNLETGEKRALNEKGEVYVWVEEQGIWQDLPTVLANPKDQIKEKLK